MSSLLTIIRDHLITANVVEGSTGWKAYIGHAADDQDKIVSMIPTGGFAQETLGNENVRETFQVKVRSGDRDYAECESKWRAVFDALQNADISGINLIQAMASGPLMFYDDKIRPCATSNFLVVRPRP